MQKSVFKHFMDNEVIKKTVIFADLFNLNIEGWRPANSEAHPNRIIFYSGNLIVGFIDIELFAPDINPDEQKENMKDNMPFTLYTPFGKILGQFNVRMQSFRYTLSNKEKANSKIEGLFRVFGIKRDIEKYPILSHIVITDKDGIVTCVEFNRIGTPEINLRKYSTQETGIQRDESLKMRTYCGHFDINHFFDKQLRSSINGTAYEDEVSTTFQFPNLFPYTKDIDLKRPIDGSTPRWLELGYVDFDVIAKEISYKSPELLTFIDEVREDLTLSANGLVPISLYDKMAHLCFGRPEDQLLFDSTQAQPINDTLKHNKVLKNFNNK